jgi:hypothetical protein
MINHYHYEGQLRSYLLQFCNIFAGLKVQTGKGECDVPEFITVPITVGSRDRVVAAIMAGNTQNRPFSIPALSANIASIGLPATRKGVGVVDRKVFLKDGGVFPDDLQTVVRVMPIPYELGIDLNIYASNTQQLHQILEQLLMIFDPSIQIQKTDAAFDWTKLTNVTLVGINNEENYPAGGDRRVLTWTLNFQLPIYISAPLDIRNEYVKTILIHLGNLQGFQVNEFDEDGNQVPFAVGFDYGVTTVTG